jgi:hypothetical protein
LTAWLTLFVLGLDLVSGWRGAQRNQPARVESDVRWPAETAAMLSLLLLVAAVHYLGFYIAGVVYLMISLVWLGKQGLRFAFITTLIAFVCIYLLFEQGLSFQLFRGVLFSG